MAAAITKSAQEHAASFSNKSRTVALVVVALAFVMDLLDSTIVNVAIPSIQSNLGASYATIQWLVAGYSLAFALLLVTGGRLGDVIGYKRMFIIGVAGFTLASFLSGVSWTPGVLIITRLLQGAMAALMVPQVMSLMQIMYKPAERGPINGLFGALGGLAASLGPIIGGLLIKANIFGWDWRPIFLINVPIGLFGIFAAVRYLPKGKSPHPLKLDITGTVILLLTLFLLVFPLIEGRDMGWPVWAFVMIVAALPLLMIFAWWQRKKMRKDGSPLVVPDLFRKRSFSLGMLVNIIFEGAMLSFFLTFTLMLQIGLGFSAIHAALTGIPVAFGIAFTMATLGNILLPKLGARSMSIGTVVMGIGLVITALLANHYGAGVHSWQFIPGLLLIGVGMGMTFVSLFAVVLNDIDVRHAGSASGVLNAVQQVGGAIGIALIGVIFFGHLASGAANSFKLQESGLRQQLTASHVPAQAQSSILAATKTCFVDRSGQRDPSLVPPSCRRAEQSGAPKTISDIVSQSAYRANAHNFAVAFSYGVIFEIVLLLITFTLSFFLPRKIRPEAMQAEII